MRLCELSFQTDDGPVKIEVFSKLGFDGFYAQGPTLSEPLEDSDLTRLLDRVAQYVRAQRGTTH